MLAESPAGPPPTMATSYIDSEVMEAERATINPTANSRAASGFAACPGARRYARAIRADGVAVLSRDRSLSPRSARDEGQAPERQHCCPRGEARPQGRATRTASHARSARERPSVLLEASRRHEVE